MRQRPMLAEQYNQSLSVNSMLEPVDFDTALIDDDE